MKRGWLRDYSLNHPQSVYHGIQACKLFEIAIDLYAALSSVDSVAMQIESDSNADFGILHFDHKKQYLYAVFDLAKIVPKNIVFRSSNTQKTILIQCTARNRLL